MTSDEPFVPEDTSIVDENCDSSKCVNSGLDNGCAICDARGVSNSLAAGYTVSDEHRISEIGCEMVIPFLISSTTAWAASPLKSFTTMLAPLDANNREYLRINELS